MRRVRVIPVLWTIVFALLTACARSAPGGSLSAPPVAAGVDQAASAEGLSALGYAQGEGAAARGAAPAATPTPAAPVPAPAPRKLVRTASLVLAVDDPQAVAARAQELATAAGGYVAAIEANRREGGIRQRLTLRVPGERLDGLLAALRELADEIDHEQIATEDVTDRYVDLEARLRALRATEQELTALLGESRARGHSAEDIMAIFRELTEIRSRIEQIQGQLQLLADRVDYSTIQLELRATEGSRPLAGEAWDPGSTVHSAVRALVGALQWLADAAIVMVIVILPVLLLIGVPLWLLGRLLRRRQPRRSSGSG